MIPGKESSLLKLSQLRSLIEGFGAKQAAEQARNNPEAIKRLNLLLEALAYAVRNRNYENFRNSDFSLHKAIMELANVPCLQDVWLVAWNGLAEFHHRTFEDCFPDPRFLTEEHEYLVETIVLGDPVAAEDAAKSHIEAVWFRLANIEDDATDNENIKYDPLQRACAHIAFQLNRPLRLEEVARKVAFTSPGHLSRLFRQHYGESFQAYLQNMRLEKSAELLRETRLPITRIAQRVGYRDLSRFGQHFRRRFKKTPSAWRKDNS